MLNKVIYPPFVFKHCIAAAIFILVLLAVAFIFMMSSSEKTFDDINQDGEISWDEIYIAWKLPGTIHWWKYIIGLIMTTWAIAVSYKIYQYDTFINQNSADTNASEDTDKKI